ncbi:MAG: sensor histidine kinase [Bacilli bacterium]|nr:sensor histidine kinase [Bacilli bacterium]
MFVLDSMYFCLELLLCENVLLFGCEKRKHFWIREVVSVLVCCGLAYLFPVPSELRYNNWYSWFRFLTIFALTSAQAFVCYKIKILPLFAFTTSGYALQHIGFHLMNLFKWIPFDRNVIRFMNQNSAYFEMLFVFVAAAVGLFTLGRVFTKRKYYQNYNYTICIISIASVLIITGITRIVRFESRTITHYASLYAIVSCTLVMILQTTVYHLINVSNENKIIRRMRENDRVHYEIAKSTIENINIKAHDLKHLLNEHPNFVDEEEREKLLNSIEFYDELKTGNHVIDVVLMDNKLRYSQKGVKYTFVGNGAALNFVREIDLASIFGNAIANASDAVVALEEEDKRNISITIDDKGDIVFVTFRNYYSGNIKFDGKFPVTSKQLHKIDHGFGLKSIEANVKKYGGEINIMTENNIFALSIYFCKEIKN